jgi:hypothetical protein
VLRRPDRPGQPEDRQQLTDQPALAERATPRSSEDLRQRLGSLPDWHPSSPIRDSRARLNDAPFADTLQTGPEPLTDAEHADRTRHIRAQLADARQRGLTSEEQFFNPADDKWTTERQLIHRDLVDGLYASAADVPGNRKAIMAGA